MRVTSTTDTHDAAIAVLQSYGFTNLHTTHDGASGMSVTELPSVFVEEVRPLVLDLDAVGAVAE